MRPAACCSPAFTRHTDARADLADLTGDDDARAEALALADDLAMRRDTARLTA